MSPEFLRNMAQQYGELAIRARTEAARAQLRLWAQEFEDMALRAAHGTEPEEPTPAPPAEPTAESGTAAEVAEAERRVRDSEECVYRQMEIVGRLEAAGDAKGVSLALELLKALEENLHAARHALHERLARQGGG